MRTFAIAIAVAVAGIVALSYFLIACDRSDSASPPPEVKSSSRELAARGDYEKWTSHLADGGSVEFEKPRRTKIPAEEVPQEEKTVQTHGKLTPTQKAIVTEHLMRSVRAAENDYRTLPTGTPEEIEKSLHAAYRIVLKSAAIDQVRNDKVWTFVSGEDEECMRTAWRNIPRGWKSLKIRNAAPHEDGKSISLIFAIDPSEHPGIQSVLDQIQAHHEEG